MRIDLHTHSFVSDGTDSPSELVINAAEAGLDIIALCDHDTFDGLAEAALTAEEIGIGLIPGIEVSCEWRGREVHLLGYYVDQSDPAFTQMLARGQESRRTRVPKMVERLVSLGFAMSVDDVWAQTKPGATIGRPHVADAMVARGYVHDRTEAFQRYLSEGGPAHVGRYKPPVTEVIDLVHQAGGVAILAHALGRQDDAADPSNISRDDITEWITVNDLDGFEVDHQDHDAAARAELRELGTELDVIMTGSSDYHGLGKKNHDLGCNTTHPDMLVRIGQRADHWARR